MRRGIVTTLAAVYVASFVGCGPRPDRTTPAEPYRGPTLGVAELVSSLNARAAGVPTLWGDGAFEANLVEVDAGGRRRTQFVNGQIRVLFARGQGGAGDGVRLVGRKDVAGQVFDAGSDGQRFWLDVAGPNDTFWHGRLDGATPDATPDTSAADAVVSIDDLPIRPELLADVLAIDAIDPDLLGDPAPVLKFNPDADAYMLTFVTQRPDRLAAVKEVWYDRQTLLPRLVALFDDNGRIVLRAYLSEHAGLDGRSDAFGPDAPRVATVYRLLFPETGTRLLIDLNAVARSRNNAPNPASFAFPEHRLRSAGTVVAVGG